MSVQSGGAGTDRAAHAEARRPSSSLGWTHGSGVTRESQVVEKTRRHQRGHCLDGRRCGLHLLSGHATELKKLDAREIPLLAVISLFLQPVHRALREGCFSCQADLLELLELPHGDFVGGETLVTALALPPPASVAVLVVSTLGSSGLMNDGVF